MTKYLCMLNPEHELLTCECRVKINSKAYCMNVCKKIKCRFRQPIEEEDKDEKQNNCRK